MIILFRSCEANLSPGSLGEGKENKPRWLDKYKLEILRKCYKSIQQGLDENDKIIIINDRTTEETLTWMKENTIADFEVVNVTSLDELRKNHPYPTYHKKAINSCVELMEFLVKTAEENLDEVIYVCEDDYLHASNAIRFIKTMLVQGNYSGFVAPYDYPDRYKDKIKIAELHHTYLGHIRTIPSATLTIAAKGSTWAEYKYDLLRAGVFADDSWTWKAFAKSGAISPLPGLAAHLQEGCITPGIDWLFLYDSLEL
jgi:glycosyltransferase involved in cell wall biosynthesis